MAEFQDKVFERVSAGDPERCQMVQHSGDQCVNRKLPNSKYCGICDQGTTKKRDNKKNIELFNIALYQERIKDFRDNPRQKTLSDEIGILRMLLENKINTCQNASQLLTSAQSIGDMIVKIQMLVVAAAKLDIQLNNTLTRAQIDVFGQKIIETISKHVDPEILELVANEIQTAIEGL